MDIRHHDFTSRSLSPARVYNACYVASMPAPTDHEQRRLQLADLAIDLIAEEGYDTVTIRRLAAATGYSTTAVTHYFPNKKAMMLHVYERCAERAQARVDAAHDADPGNLEACLAALLPIGAMARKEWQAHLAFWPHALKDPELRQRQLWWMRKAEQTLASASTLACPAAGEAGCTHALLATVVGIGVSACFDPSWTDEAQRAELPRLVAAHFAAGHHAATRPGT